MSAPPRHWASNLVELIRRTSTDLPPDIEAGLIRARDGERKGSTARELLEAVLANVALARRDSIPICQDTGTLTFFVSVPTGCDTNAVKARIRGAVSYATRRGILRVNTVDAVGSGVYTANVACYAPIIHLRQGARKTVEIRLLMKGGGCENVGRQYELPDVTLGAERDVEGVRRCVLDAVWRAQGRGCAPGIVGVCMGGDRATGYAHAKEQFLRRLDDASPVSAFATLEQRIARDAARLAIGPMGMGGRATLLGVKVGAAARLPASCYVTVSYMCWACRRRGVTLGPEGGVKRWFY